MCSKPSAGRPLSRATPTSPGQPTRVFVYGTLKSGGVNHGFLKGQVLVGVARTAPGFVLYELDGYPGMVPDPDATEGVAGEVWDVDDACLAALDELEGVNEGLYRREIVPLRGAEGQHVQIQAYVFHRSISGRKRLGGEWP